MFSTRWEDRLAVLAFIMRYAAWSKLVSRITIGVLVLLGRVSGTVCTTDMPTLAARLVTGEEESLAFVAGSSDTLAGLLVNQVLTTSLARSGKNNMLLLEWVVVVGNDGCILLIGLDDGGSPLTAGDNLGFSALGRITGTFGTTGVLAVGAFLSRGKGGAAFVAGSSNAHADGLIHAKNSVVGRATWKVRKLDFETIALAQLLGTLFKQLVAGKLGDALHALILDASLVGLGDLDYGGRFCLSAGLCLGSRAALASNHGRQAFS